MDLVPLVRTKQSNSSNNNFLQPALADRRSLGELALQIAYECIRCAWPPQRSVPSQTISKYLLSLWTKSVYSVDFCRKPTTQTRQSPRQSDTAPGRLSMPPPQAVYHHPHYFIQSMPSTKPSWPSPNPRRPRHNTYRRRMHEVCVPTHIPTQSCANSPCNKMVIPFYSPG